MNKKEIVVTNEIVMIKGEVDSLLKLIRKDIFVISRIGTSKTYLVRGYEGEGEGKWTFERKKHGVITFCLDGEVKIAISV